MSITVLRKIGNLVTFLELCFFFFKLNVNLRLCPLMMDNIITVDVMWLFHFVMLFSDADRNLRWAVQAVWRLLRAERDSAVRVQWQTRGVRAERQHEPVREVRAGPGGERDMRLGGAAHQGGDRGGWWQTRRRHHRGHVGWRGRGRRAGRGRGTPVRLQRPRLLGRRRANAVDVGRHGKTAGGNVQKPVRRHHGRRRGQDGERPEEQAEENGQRQVHRARSVLAFGQLFPRTRARQKQ